MNSRTLPAGRPGVNSGLVAMSLDRFVCGVVSRPVLVAGGCSLWVNCCWSVAFSFSRCEPVAVCKKHPKIVSPRTDLFFGFYSCLMSICNRMVMIDLLPVVMCDIFSLPREFLPNKILFPPPPSRPLISSAADLRGRIRQQTFRTPTGTPLRKQSDKNKRAEAKTLVVALSIDKLQ